MVRVFIKNSRLLYAGSAGTNQPRLRKVSIRITRVLDGKVTRRQIFDERIWQPHGQEESSSTEVQAVVSFALEHAKKAPELTLGVITMGIRHRLKGEAAD
jgi:hypothetical protein